MTDELKVDLLRVLVKHNLANENLLRNEEIKFEYSELRKQGTSGRCALEQLAEKHHRDKKTIEFIIYGKHKS